MDQGRDKGECVVVYKKNFAYSGWRKVSSVCSDAAAVASIGEEVGIDISPSLG